MHPRTYLFVPADRPERFAKAITSGADRVVIDLEGAEKPEAKTAARQGLASALFDWSRIVIRINDIASDWWSDDWAAIAALPVAAVLAPKAEDPAGLAGFGAKLLIHLRQVAIVRRIFAPSEAEVAWARRVIAALQAAGSGGAVTVDGRKVDNAARQVLAVHEEIQE